MESDNLNDNQVQQPVVENVALQQIQGESAVQPVVEQPVVDVPVQPKKKSKTGVIVAAIVFSCLLFVMLGAGLVLMLFHFNPDFISRDITNVNKVEKKVTISENGIADSVEKIYNSVVIVKNYKNSQLSSTGSGFIYKKSENRYYIITNYHVIQGGTEISVVFTNKSEKYVKVEGGDKYSDIAVLSIDTDMDLEVAELGSSTDMRVGDTVFALGTPLDSNIYSWTVTRGILSGKDREVEVSTNGYSTDWVMLVLQTDAAINSGNSGGPLCNGAGQVIGVTNMKLVTSGVEGMGFAIPIESAESYANDIVSGKEVSRPKIGVSMSDASSEPVAEKYGVKAREGALITDMEKGSPADKAGLKVGDILIAMNDEEITSTASLRYRLYKYKSGDTVDIKFIRDAKEYSTKLKLG